LVLQPLTSKTIIAIAKHASKKVLKQTKKESRQKRLDYLAELSGGDLVAWRNPGSSLRYR